MKNKFSLLCILVLCLLISISTVAAADINSTDTYNVPVDADEGSADTVNFVDDDNTLLDDDVDNNDSDNYLLGASNDEVLRSGSSEEILRGGTGTFTQLTSECTVGGNIVLTKDIYNYNSGGRIEITKKTNVIDGNGAVINMAGANLESVFYVSTSSSDIIFKNLTIKNLVSSSSTYMGGCFYILSAKSVSFENCNFINCNVRGFGGCIYASGCPSYLKNCNFTEIEVSGSNNGGILNLGAYSTFENCNFINITASGNPYGTVMRAQINVTVKNCNFINIKGYYYGTAIVIAGSYKSIIENCNFINNSAKTEPGDIIYATGSSSNVSIINTNFTNNKGYFSGPYLYVDNCNITNNDFVENSNGYVIYFSKNATFKNTVILNNYVGKSSIAYVNNNGIVTFRLTGYPNLLNAIRSDTDVFSFDNVTYWGVDGIMNTGNNTFTRSIYEQGMNITFTVKRDGVVVDEFVRVTGVGGDVTLDYSQIPGEYEITAQHDKDAYYSDSRSTAKFTVTSPSSINLTVFGNTLIANVTRGATGTVTFTIKNETGTVNESTVNLNDDSIAEFDLSNLTVGTYNFTATYNGDTIYQSSTDSMTYTKSGTYTDLQMLIDAATGDVLDVPFDVVFDPIYDLSTSNPYYGIIDFTQGVLINKTLTINGNKYTISGKKQARIFQVTADDVVLKNINFIDGKSNTQGGAVYFNSNGIIDNSSFVNCSSTSEGGALYFKDGSGTVSGSTFTNCSGTSGGAINFCKNNNNVINSTFINCHASGIANAIFFVDEMSECSVNYSIFLNNTGSQYDVYGASNADYNWWGNNVTDYNNIPPTETYVNNWYFLNMTARDNFATINLNNLYIRDTGIITDNNCHLPVANFTLTANDATLDKNSALVKDGVGTFTYDGNPTTLTANYISASILCKSANMNVTADTIIYGENATIIVELPTDARGNVTITINGRKQTFVLNNTFTGTIEYEIPNLSPGEYPIDVYYTGGDNYIGSDNTIDLIVDKIKTNITLNIDAGYINEIVNITATLPDAAVDNVTIIVNSKIYSIASGEVLQLDLNAGYWDVIASYSGDEFCTSALVLGNFTVEKYESSINITATTPIIGAKSIIEFNLTEGATGDVVIYVNGSRYIVDATDKMLSVTLDEPGAYMINATYVGDSIYAESKSNNVIVTVVAKQDTPINVDDFEIKVGEDAVVNITVPSGLNGQTIAVSVNGLSRNAIVDANGRASATFNGLGEGVYEIHVSYDGNDYYNANSTTAFITVVKHNSTVNVTATSVRTGNPVTVNVNASGNGIANIIIIKDSNILGSYNISINNGKGSFIIPIDFVEGNYDLNVTYLGDDIYYSSTNTTTFSVGDRIISDLNITKPEFTVNTPSIIDVTTNFPSGNVDVYVDGVKQASITINNKAGTINLNGLAAGNHTILTYYAGDYNYTDLTKSFDIYVEKLQSNVNVTATSVRTGNPVTVNVNASGNGIANIIIIKDNNILGSYNISINNGKGSFIIPIDFVEGNYNLNVTYLGDDIYYSSTNTTTFSVGDRIISDLNITKPEFTVNTPSIIDVTTNFPSGNVDIYVDGVKQASITINNKAGTINLNGLAAGNHTILTYYAGDYNYTDLTKSFDIYVEKLQSNVNVTATSVRTGNPVTVNVNASGNGIANIIIIKDSNILGSYNISINNGKGSFIIPIDFVEGDYDLNVTYLGDDIYYSSTNTTTFSVGDRIISDLNITKPEFTVNTPSIIDVTTNFPSGNVDVYVDGVKQASITINNKAGTINLNGLAAGNHTILTYYAGDYNYTDLTKSFDIYVEKLQSNVNVTATSVRTGNQVVINVTASGSGSANVAILNETGIIGSYNITINNGKGSFIVPLTFVDGEYIANVTYYGDEIYYGSTNTTSFTVVNRIESHLEFDIPIVYVTVPSSVNVTSNFPSGVLTVYVDGIKQNDSVIINNNKGEIYLPGLSAASHNILVTYDGDYNFTALTTAFVIDVVKFDSSVNASANGIYQNHMVEVDINASGDGSAILVVYNNDMIIGSYDVAIAQNNAKFLIPYTFSDAGMYYINVTYSGNDYYYGSTNTCNFIVHDSYDYLFNISVNDINVGESATVNVNLPSDANGLVLLDVNGTSYAVNITDGKGKITISDLKHGNYLVIGQYLGDDKYLSTVNVTTFNVDKIPIGEIKVNSNGIKNGIAIVNVAVTYTDATGEVTITVNGNNYTGKLLDGKTTIEVTDLVNEENPFNLIYEGDGKYLSNATNGFIVENGSFIESFINVTATDAMVDGETIVTVTLLSDATGEVRVEVCGNSYIKTVNNGTVVFNISNLVAGECIVNAVYLGDDKYYTSFNSTKIFISRYNSTIDIADAWGLNGEEITISVNAKNDTNGEMTLCVNNQNYTEIMKDGVCKFNIVIDDIGVYDLTVYYSGSDYYNPNVVNSTVEVYSKVRIDENHDLVKDYLDSTQPFKVRALDKWGAPVGAGEVVKMTISGKTYNVKTDKNGYASLAIDLVPGEYSITAEYAGYNVTNKISVCGILVAYDAQFKTGKPFTYTATLRSSAGKGLYGKTIYFTVKGKTYSAVTDARGLAKITLPKTLQTGSYTVKVKYEQYSISRIIKIVK